jgi:O-antigen/teichoic acid export membrane protein
MRPQPEGRPTWEAPGLYGHPQAVQSVGTVVAPLLAGFSISLTVLVIDRGDALWCEDLALGLLVAAAGALLVAIQCAYSARQYLVAPDEIEAWRPDVGLRGELGREARDDVRAEQRGHAALHERWAERFRRSYHAGILLLLLALVAILLPAGDWRWSRIAVVALAGALVVVEVVWILAVSKRRLLPRRVRDWIVPPYDRVPPADDGY